MRVNEIELLKILTKNIELQNTRNIEGVMNQIHDKSPSYETTHKVLSEIFNIYELENTLLDSFFIGGDGGYIYMRTIQKTEKIAGPDFDPNIAESVVVFKDQGGEWKIWNQFVLSVKMI